MKNCKYCRWPIDGHDDASKESKTDPCACVGCVSHREAEAEQGGGVLLDTNESHDPNDWTWS